MIRHIINTVRKKVILMVDYIDYHKLVINKQKQRFSINANPKMMDCDYFRDFIEYFIVSPCFKQRS